MIIILIMMLLLKIIIIIIIIIVIMMMMMMMMMMIVKKTNINISSLLLLRNCTKRFRQYFATFCFRAEIRRLKTEDRLGGGGFKDSRSCQRNVWEREGSSSTSKTEGTAQTCCKKQFEKNKTLPKALKLSDCRDRIRRQIQPSYKKS